MAITIHNTRAEPLAVHWHGMELESRYDGVGGWSGTPASVTPPIAPGDSFTVRFTPPPAHQRAASRPAALLVGVGETYDLELSPDVARRAATLEVETRFYPGAPGSLLHVARFPVRVAEGRAARGRQNSSVTPRLGSTPSDAFASTIRSRAFHW